MQPHGGSKGVNETELWRSLRGKSQAKDEAVRAADEEQLPPLRSCLRMLRRAFAP